MYATLSIRTQIKYVKLRHRVFSVAERPANKALHLTPVNVAKIRIIRRVARVAVSGAMVIGCR